VPQIANQVLRRFTRQGEIVVDLFSGMGTTMIECRHLGRQGIGVELSPTVTEASLARIAEAENPHEIITNVLTANSADPATRDLLLEEIKARGGTAADIVILHPPYHDIIRFSEDDRDLSNATSLDEFLAGFGAVAENAFALLRPGRFMVLVIGDKYANSEWVPLGFRCMQVCSDLGFQLKAINVKDIQGNERGKGKNENLWRYRALRQGFYLFKHEYVMVFRKPTADQRAAGNDATHKK
jgi:DNA modification methylase